MNKIEIPNINMNNVNIAKIDKILIPKDGVSKNNHLCHLYRMIVEELTKTYIGELTNDEIKIIKYEYLKNVLERIVEETRSYKFILYVDTANSIREELGLEKYEVIRRQYNE